MRRYSVLHISRGVLAALGFTALTGFGCPAAFAQAASGAQAATGAPGATITLDGKQLPPPTPNFGGGDQGKGVGITALVGSACHAAKGCAERAADHDR